MIEKRGQISVEYLIIIGLLLLALIPLMYYSTREANTAATQGSAEDVVNTLAVAADEVYALGPGSRKIVEVNMPKGVVGASIGGIEEETKKEIKLVIRIYGGTSDIFATTKSEIKGGIPTSSGPKRIEVVALEDSVLIGGDTYPPVVVSTSPSGIINDINPMLVAITDESAECKFVSGDVNFDYDAQGTLMEGTGTSHTVQLSGLSEGSYTYSVKCRDFADPPNTMQQQALIQFTISFVSGDFTPPEVDLFLPENAHEETESSLITFKYKTCDPTFASCGDDSAISSCTLTITQTGGDFVINVIDSNVAEDTIEDIKISLGNGEYHWKVSCKDSSANANEGESETRLITLNVPPGGKIIGGLIDKGIDSGFYYKTNGEGLSTTDNNMAATLDITLYLLDDNVNTPPTTSVLRHRSTEKYEGFWVELDEETAQYDKIVLYGRMRIIDTDPFTLIAHGYQSDMVTPNLDTLLEFQVSDITGEKVKWVELDITDIARLEDGFGQMKFRVSAKNLASQENKRFQFSELHIKVGNYL